MRVTLPASLLDIPGHLKQFEVSLRLYQLHQPVQRRASASTSSCDTVAGVTKPAVRVETKANPNTDRDIRNNKGDEANSKLSHSYVIPKLPITQASILGFNICYEAIYES
ncbi:hypothetical protein V6N13_092007 [Hibiscus sabdariffa]|uniref:Uncharacterized protein n=1 Tax=Hibiscus sabdariffa TaxID=183260 RepID=A0ABR2QFQ6_9ROSI